MESLNLLRYLVLRDNILKNAVSQTYLTPTNILAAIWLLQKPSNFPRFFQVGVWAEVCRLKDKYLTILRVCISLSRTYYCAEVKSLREEQKQKAKGKNELPGSQIVHHSLFEISQPCTHRGQRHHQSRKTGQKHKSEARESIVLPSRSATSGIES